MAANKSEERQQIYIIPENFIEGGRVLNGTFRTRNFIEAVILGGIFALLGFMIPTKDLTARIAIEFSVALPPAFLAIIGINDDAFSVFVRNAIKWKRNHRIMIYNAFTQAYEQAPIDVMMSEDLPKDKLIGKYESWRDKRIDDETNRRAAYVYEFEEDLEMAKMQRREPMVGHVSKKTKKQRMAAEELDTLLLYEYDEQVDPFEEAGGDNFVINDAGAYLRFDEDDDDDFVI